MDHYCICLPKEQTNICNIQNRTYFSWYSLSQKIFQFSFTCSFNWWFSFRQKNDPQPKILRKSESLQINNFCFHVYAQKYLQLCHMLYVKCFCWSLGHAKQLLFAYLCSNVTVYGWKCQCFLFPSSATATPVTFEFIELTPS